MSDFRLVQSEDGVHRCVDQDNPAYNFDVYPLDMGRSSPPEDLAVEVASCLRSEIESIGCNPRPRDLLGSCHRNARELFDHLVGAGYSPILHLGANEGAGVSKGIVDSFENVRNVHQWVQVGSYTVEICSEASQAHGKLYVSQQRPSNYKSFHALSQSQLNGLSVKYIDANNIRQVLEELGY